MRCKVVRGTFILGGEAKNEREKAPVGLRKNQRVGRPLREFVRTQCVHKLRVSGFEQNKCEWEQEGGQEWECRVRPSLVALM